MRFEGSSAGAARTAVRTDWQTAVDDLLRSGLTGDVRVCEDGRLCCGVCGYSATPDEVELRVARRLDEPGDPDAIVAVLAVVCPACRAEGAAVVPASAAALTHDAVVRAALAR